MRNLAKLLMFLTLLMAGCRPAPVAPAPSPTPVYIPTAKPAPTAAPAAQSKGIYTPAPTPAARLARIPIASAKYRADVIREAHAKGGLAAPAALFAAQLTQESQFNPNAKSVVGAQGLAQFMPATAQWLTTVSPKDFPTANSLDPQWSIRALVFYDYWLYARLPMYVDADQNRWAGALSAYNGGLGYTLKDAKLGKCQTWWACAENVNDGRSASNLKENRGYPQAIIRKWEPAYQAAGWR